jgi:microcystin-dependent protein
MGRNVDNIGGLAQAAANVATPINRRNIRFLDGGGITWSVVDDPGNNEVEVSAVAGGAAAAPPGAVLGFAGAAAPSGWLLCDGTSYLTATYPALFAAIGYTWGGAGPNFNVPDMARRTMVGSGGVGTGTLGNAVGNVGGAETHVLTVPELAAHNHPENVHSHNVTLSTQGVGGLDVLSGGNSYLMMTGTFAGGPFPQFGTTSSVAGSNINTGSNTPHNNVQPSAVVMVIIKT